MPKPIAIIGGGPGGLFAAIRAAELGLRVILYEKRQIGYAIKCAEGFMDSLGILEKPEPGILFKVEKVIFMTDKEHLVHFGDNYDIWMIDRGTWQKSLAKKAYDLGVSVKENYPIDKRRLQEMRDTHNYIIDASGAPSVTSRMHGFVSTYLKNALILAQCSVEGDFSFLGKNTIKIVYEPHYAGYNYIFPKGQDIANVGIGRYNLNKKNRALHLNKELNDFLITEGLDRYRILKKFQSFTPSTSVARLVWGNILLVGDAATLSSPLHGGGLDMALISGRLAAELIASNQISLYPTKLWEIIGEKLTMEKRIYNLLLLFGYPLLHYILRFPWLVKGIFFNRIPVPQIVGFGGKKMF
jgi:digeranylgeranylglycerophospholipid reductase